MCVRDENSAVVSADSSFRAKCGPHYSRRARMVPFAVVFVILLSAFAAFGQDLAITSIKDALITPDPAVPGGERNDFSYCRTEASPALEKLAFSISAYTCAVPETLRPELRESIEFHRSPQRQ